jgi:hypothetical protein
LGHRSADAWALAAKAHDLAGDETSARACYQNATVLAPAMELSRRYPEVSDLLEKFVPAAAPPEAA